MVLLLKPVGVVEACADLKLIQVLVPILKIF